ncbi:glutathione S-transferase [Penaeus vannamei]|uniref:glutathione transferase n=1 Tax=Penaeus vannamei TaxID=6689 RepID=A0A3R7SMK3_PENVA|nr:glutathione S-transferase [Penaeus vannamei]
MNPSLSSCVPPVLRPSLYPTSSSSSVSSLGPLTSPSSNPHPSVYGILLLYSILTQIPSPLSSSQFYPLLNTPPPVLPHMRALPYYIDGDVRITHANAIMRHLARTRPLRGDEKERIRVDMIENQANDFRNTFIRLCYLDFNMQKHRYLEALPQTLKQFSQFLGSNPWFAGDKITFVDFIMYELLDQHLQLSDICLKDVKNLQEFQKRFESLEPIQRYMSSPRFMRSPINNKMAKFGTQ